MYFFDSQSPIQGTYVGMIFSNVIMNLWNSNENDKTRTLSSVIFLARCTYFKDVSKHELSNFINFNWLVLVTKSSYFPFTKITVYLEKFHLQPVFIPQFTVWAHWNEPRIVRVGFRTWEYINNRHEKSALWKWTQTSLNVHCFAVGENSILTW